jgi:hypothetical protein
VISGSTEPHLFIDNPNQSPFNVAKHVQLRDFNTPEMDELNRRHPHPLEQTQLKQLMDLIAGRLK